jgi:hypothetical protein
MTKSNRADSYIFTADANSAADMQQIDVVKKTVRASNRLAMQNYKWQCRRAQFNGNEMPKKPAQYRVRLMPRGPRKASYEHNLATGGYRVWSGYNSYLPQRYATRFDIYVHEVR